MTLAVVASQSGWHVEPKTQVPKGGTWGTLLPLYFYETYVTDILSGLLSQPVPVFEWGLQRATSHAQCRCVGIFNRAPSTSFINGENCLLQLGVGRLGGY